MAFCQRDRGLVSGNPPTTRAVVHVPDPVEGRVEDEGVVGVAETVVHPVDGPGVRVGREGALEGCPVAEGVAAPVDLGAVGLQARDGPVEPGRPDPLASPPRAASRRSPRRGRPSRMPQHRSGSRTSHRPGLGCCPATWSWSRRSRRSPRPSVTTSVIAPLRDRERGERATWRPRCRREAPADVDGVGREPKPRTCPPMLGAQEETRELSAVEKAATCPCGTPSTVLKSPPT